MTCTAYCHATVQQCLGFVNLKCTRQYNKVHVWRTISCINRSIQRHIVEHFSLSCSRQCCQSATPIALALFVYGPVLYACASAPSHPLHSMQLWRVSWETFFCHANFNENTEHNRPANLSNCIHKECINAHRQENQRSCGVGCSAVRAHACLFKCPGCHVVCRACALWAFERVYANTEIICSENWGNAQAKSPASACK